MDTPETNTEQKIDRRTLGNNKIGVGPKKKKPEGKYYRTTLTIPR